MIVDDLRRHLRESAVWYGGLGLLAVRDVRTLEARTEPPTSAAEPAVIAP